MAHAVSASSFRSDHVPPSALALAVLLHALVALAIWWLSLQRPHPPTEEAIEVTIEQPRIEQPKPEPPPLPPERQAAPPPPPLPPVEGLRPPAPIIADKPTQVPPSGERPDRPPAPPPPPLQDSLPAPEPPPPPSTAELARPDTAGPKPPDHAPPAQRDALLAPQPHPSPEPTPTKPNPQPQPQLQRPELRPSPLTVAPPMRPPGGKPGESPTHSPFVNPADTYNRARAADNYLWEVVRKLVGYRYEAHVNASQGLTVVRVVIARDGRLLDVRVARSSGYPEFDQGVLAGVRAGSPYTPLPPEIPGDSASFDLPLVSVHRN